MTNLTYTERHCLPAILEAVRPYRADELGYRGFAERVRRSQLFRCARTHLIRAAYVEAWYAEQLTPLPADYELCGQCGFDHSYEYPQAHTWHTENDNA